MLLELKNIKKYFPVRPNLWGRAQGVVKAVDDVSLQIVPGQHLSIVGESGCGKTTLARILLKLIMPDAGSIIFNGEDISHIPGRYMRQYRKNMQMVFQDPYSSLDPRFSVRNIFKEAMTLAKEEYPTEDARLDRTSGLLESVGLRKHDLLNRYPHEFSGGERQRIAIARALVLNPKLLVLDEAVSSLDVLIQEQIMELLSGLQAQFKLTYLFISHNLRIVKKISHRIAVMYRGRIVELGSVSQIFEEPLHPYTKELLAAAMEYKSVKRAQDFLVPAKAALVDQGDGHWVLEH